MQVHYDRGTTSSLFEKLPPDRRAAIDQTILDHQPATFRALFEKFDLAEHGVSFMAFYRYGRRLRERASLHSIAEVVSPDDPDVASVLPAILGRRLTDELLNNDRLTARTISRLVYAWRLAARSMLDFQKAAQATRIADDTLSLKRQELDEQIATNNDIRESLVRAQNEHRRWMAHRAERAEEQFKIMLEQLIARGPQAVIDESPPEAPAPSASVPADSACGTGFQPVRCTTGFQPVESVSPTSEAAEFDAAGRTSEPTPQGMDRCAQDDSQAQPQRVTSP